MARTKSCARKSGLVRKPIVGPRKRPLRKPAKAPKGPLSNVLAKLDASSLARVALRAAAASPEAMEAVLMSALEEASKKATKPPPGQSFEEEYFRSFKNVMLKASRKIEEEAGEHWKADLFEPHVELVKKRMASIPSSLSGGCQLQILSYLASVMLEYTHRSRDIISAEDAEQVLLDLDVEAETILLRDGARGIPGPVLVQVSKVFSKENWEEARRSYGMFGRSSGMLQSGALASDLHMLLRKYSST